MKSRHSRPIGEAKPERKGKISRRKSQMLRVARKWKPITNPQLREAYSAKIEWARKLIPELKKEAEGQKEKES